MRCIVLWPTCSTATACKGRSNQVGETNEMVLGEVACDVLNRLLSGRCEGWLTTRIHARGDCIQSRGRNAYVSYTNYLRRTHALARTPRHAPTGSSPAHPPGYTHPIQSLLIVTFLLPSYHATLCLLTSVQPQHTTKCPSNP